MTRKSIFNVKTTGLPDISDQEALFCETQTRYNLSTPSGVPFGVAVSSW